MDTKYITFANGAVVAMIGKVGSSALAQASFLQQKPDYTILGGEQSVARAWNNPGWQTRAPKYDGIPDDAIIPVRDPVERFRSAVSQVRQDVDSILTRLERGWKNYHFTPVVDYLVKTSRLYQFPEHISELETACGINLPTVNEGNNPPKPDLTEEQEASVRALYAADIALYESITEPGKLYIHPIPAGAKEALLEQIANARWQAEVGGITLPDGTHIDTSRESQAMITGALSYLSMQPEGTTIRWKADTGWIDIDLPTLQTIGTAVGAHVQACFAHESELASAIAIATTPDDLAEITWH